MTYGKKADTRSIFATACPNHFEICPVRVVYGWNNLNLVECSRILVEIVRGSRSRFYHKHIYNCLEEELKLIRELRNPGRDISYPMFIRKEIETRKLERKSKQKIFRLIDLLYHLNDIISRENDIN